MDSESANNSSTSTSKESGVSGQDSTPSMLQPSVVATENTGKSSFERFTRLVDSSRNAVKAVQVKARHIVSQNKRRYQEGGFDLDMTYITENIIAMGFPAGDISSGLFGYLEGFYRNHMEEVIRFFETNHKVASFPFEDHNCPPIQLILLFCQSVYSWLKEDIENVIVVHCKAGVARTGLMISSLLLFLKFLPTSEESIDYYNQKRCLDGKGLVLPSQIRYVKYFERVLTEFDGKSFREHACSGDSGFTDALSGSDLPLQYLIIKPEDFWIGSRKKGILVFALPGEPGVAELAGDFKIHFHDRQGDFYCWLNTTMMENRKILETSDLDGFDKSGFTIFMVYQLLLQRNLPSPGFQVEIVLIEYNGEVLARPKSETTNREVSGNLSYGTASGVRPALSSNSNKGSEGTEDHDKDDVFSDSESEDNESSRRRQCQATSSAELATSNFDHKSGIAQDEKVAITHGSAQVSLNSGRHTEILKTETDGSNRETSHHQAPKLDSMGASDIKAIAADASVFSFGDEEDSESE
ncbi:hypothetical protein IFM89_029134 [Coptis chinensis]|uniref:Phosphatidylinositol-3,4,5-trisphosphate 3-phosphatase n=1 Tax=Coptis chinensis TaxID=261450 RepID=A0A835IR78_9MAGN|nr:hypothetical protein IFM89_029134 [Coptis chinensis]